MSRTCISSAEAVGLIVMLYTSYLFLSYNHEPMTDTDPELQQVLRVRHHFTGPDIDPNNFANEAKLPQYEKYSKKFKFEDSVERGLLNRANATNGFLYDFEVEDAHNFTEKVDSDEIVFLILGCRNWSYKMKSQLRTWLSFAKHYFFATDAAIEDIPNAVVLDRSFHGATATYISAGERHWNSMLWLNEEKSDLLAKLKWIVLVDDDTWMNIPKLLEFLSSYNYKHNIAIGQVFHELFTKNRTFLQGGSGIVLSRTAFYAVTDKLFKPACRYNLHGDLSLWSCYKVAGTLLIHSDMFHQWSVTYDNLKNYHVFMPHRYVNEISFHYISNHFVSMKMTCDVAQYWEHQEPFGCKEMRRVTNNSFYLKQPHLLSLRYSYY